MLISCTVALALVVAQENQSIGSQSDIAQPVTDQPEVTIEGESREAGVAWYASWESGVAEAKRSQRPIMLQFMRPACRGVSGVF